MTQTELTDKAIESANESLKIAIQYKELLRYTIWYFAYPESPSSLINYQKFRKDYLRVSRKLQNKIYC